MSTTTRLLPSPSLQDPTLIRYRGHREHRGRLSNVYLLGLLGLLGLVVMGVDASPVTQNRRSRPMVQDTEPTTELLSYYARYFYRSGMYLDLAEEALPTYHYGKGEHTAPLFFADEPADVHVQAFTSQATAAHLDVPSSPDNTGDRTTLPGEGHPIDSTESVAVPAAEGWLTRPLLNAGEAHPYSINMYALPAPSSLDASALSGADVPLLIQGMGGTLWTSPHVPAGDFPPVTLNAHIWDMGMCICDLPSHRLANVDTCLPAHPLYTARLASYTRPLSDALSDSFQCANIEGTGPFDVPRVSWSIERVAIKHSIRSTTEVLPPVVSISERQVMGSEHITRVPRLEWTDPRTGRVQRPLAYSVDAQPYYTDPAEPRLYQFTRLPVKQVSGDPARVRHPIDVIEADSCQGGVSVLWIDTNAIVAAAMFGSASETQSPEEIMNIVSNSAIAIEGTLCAHGSMHRTQCQEFNYRITLADVVATQVDTDVMPRIQGWAQEYTVHMDQAVVMRSTPTSSRAVHAGMTPTTGGSTALSTPPTEWTAVMDLGTTTVQSATIHTFKWAFPSSDTSSDTEPITTVPPPADADSEPEPTPDQRRRAVEQASRVAEACEDLLYHAVETSSASTTPQVPMEAQGAHAFGVRLGFSQWSMDRLVSGRRHARDLCEESQTTPLPVYNSNLFAPQLTRGNPGTPCHLVCPLRLTLQYDSGITTPWKTSPGSVRTLDQLLPVFFSITVSEAAHPSNVHVVAGPHHQTLESLHRDMLHQENINRLPTLAPMFAMTVHGARCDPWTEAEADATPTPDATAMKRQADTRAAERRRSLQEPLVQVSTTATGGVCGPSEACDRLPHTVIPETIPVQCLSLAQREITLGSSAGNTQPCDAFHRQLTDEQFQWVATFYSHSGCTAEHEDIQTTMRLAQQVCPSKRPHVVTRCARGQPCTAWHPWVVYGAVCPTPGRVPSGVTKRAATGAVAPPPPAYTLLWVPTSAAICTPTEYTLQVAIEPKRNQAVAGGGISAWDRWALTLDATVQPDARATLCASLTASHTTTRALSQRRQVSDETASPSPSATFYNELKGTFKLMVYTQVTRRNSASCGKNGDDVYSQLPSIEEYADIGAIPCKWMACSYPLPKTSNLVYSAGIGAALGLMAFVGALLTTHLNWRAYTLHPPVVSGTSDHRSSTNPIVVGSVDPRGDATADTPVVWPYMDNYDDSYAEPTATTLQALNSMADTPRISGFPIPPSVQSGGSQPFSETHSRVPSNRGGVSGSGTGLNLGFSSSHSNVKGSGRQVKDTTVSRPGRINPRPASAFSGSLVSGSEGPASTFEYGKYR